MVFTCEKEMLVRSIIKVIIILFIFEILVVEYRNLPHFLLEA